MIKHSGFNNLSEGPSGDSSRDGLLKDQEPLVEASRIDENANPDSSPLDVFGSESDTGLGVSDDVIEETSTVSDTQESEVGRSVSAPDASAAERPAVLDTFSEIERRIKLLVEEKKQIIEERNQLRQQLDDARRMVTDSEEKINDLLLIKERYRSFTDQQEMVRTKVENLLSLLETEEE